MQTYYFQFNIFPTLKNKHFGLTEGANACCWVVSKDVVSAINIATFHVEKDEWCIEKIDFEPTVCEYKDFEGKDIGQKQFLKAQSDGISIFYSAWARDRTTYKEIGNPEFGERPNIEEYLQDQKRATGKGRCLHFNADGSCKNYINAHSIQKNQSLSAIAAEGEVYMISSKYSDIKKHKGRLQFEKAGIKKASTFLGFCKDHDNELFAPIDDFPLFPTDQQIMLYAYRSLCRELFVKQNSVELYKKKAHAHNTPLNVKNVLKGMLEGSYFGLNNLEKQKKWYDHSLGNKEYHSVRYVIFNFAHKPDIAFSGLLFPDFDFLGNKVQNLGDHSLQLELITFCSAPTNQGWAYIFAWHKNNATICEHYMRTLATLVHEEQKLEDILFRLVVQCCENLAISPKWLESLTKEIIENISSVITDYANPLSTIDPNYLMEGLTDICEWEIDTVQSHMK